MLIVAVLLNILLVIVIVEKYLYILAYPINNMLPIDKYDLHK